MEIGTPIKIFIKTNIPNKPSIELNSSMLYYPDLKKDKLNNLPYFTSSYNYDYNKISSLPYQDIVNFFFNIKIFNDKINDYAIEIKEDDIDENIVNKENIMIMLKCLFHINSSIYDDLNNSYDKLFPNNENVVQVDNIFNLNKIKSTFKKERYSYLSVDNQVYTFQKLIWLNDIYNHPIYHKLLLKYIVFKKWMDGLLKNDNTVELYNGIRKQPFDTNISNYSNEYNYERYHRYGERSRNPFLKYQQYLNFYNIIRDLKHKHTTNEKLQHIIDDVNLNKGDKQKAKEFFIIFDKLVENIKNNNYRNTTEPIVDVGITNDVKSGENSYEIYILADFIKGEVTDDTYDKIKCFYNSNKLGEFLKGSETIEGSIKNSDEIFDMNSGKLIENENNDEENELKKDKNRGGRMKKNNTKRRRITKKCTKKKYIRI